MSLINKMLQDLESRKNPQVEGAPKKSVYEDLKPISKLSSSPASSRRIAMLLAALVLIGGGAYAWMQWGDSLMTSLSSEKVVAKSSSSVAPRTPAPKPVPASAPVPPSAPAEKPAELPVTMTQAQAQSAPPVAVAEQKKPETPPAAAPKKTATPAKAKSAAAMETGYWTVSRGETLYGISVQTGIELWDLSKWNGLGQEHVIHPGQRLRLTPTAKSATRQAKEEKTGPAEKQKTVVASAKPSEQKSEPKTAPAAAPSAKVSQINNAVLDKKVKPFSPDEKAESEYRQAVDQLQKGRMTDAEKHLKLALKANEAHTPARELLAGLMLQQGHWREAQQTLEQGIGKVPKHYPFAQLLARVYVEHGADQKALAVMEESREVAAASPDYVAFLAALYQRAGRHAEAVKTYTEAVTLNPQEGRWWLGMGISHEALQDWNAAGNAYQRAVDSGALDDNLLKYARQRLAIVKNK